MQLTIDWKFWLIANTSLHFFGSFCQARNKTDDLVGRNMPSGKRAALEKKFSVGYMRPTDDSRSVSRNETKTVQFSKTKKPKKPQPEYPQFQCNPFTHTITRTYTYQYRDQNGTVKTFSENKKLRVQILYVVTHFRLEGMIHYRRRVYFEFPPRSQYYNGPNGNNGGTKRLKKINVGPALKAAYCLDDDRKRKLTEASFKAKFSNGYKNSVGIDGWRLTYGDRSPQEDEETKGTSESSKYFVDKPDLDVEVDIDQEVEPSQADPPLLPENGTFETVTSVVEDAEERELERDVGSEPNASSYSATNTTGSTTNFKQMSQTTTNSTAETKPDGTVSITVTTITKTAEETPDSTADTGGSLASVSGTGSNTTESKTVVTESKPETESGPLPSETASESESDKTVVTVTKVSETVVSSDLAEASIEKATTTEKQVVTNENQGNNVGGKKETKVSNTNGTNHTSPADRTNNPMPAGGGPEAVAYGDIAQDDDYDADEGIREDYVSVNERSSSRRHKSNRRRHPYRKSQVGSQGNRGDLKDYEYNYDEPSTHTGRRKGFTRRYSTSEEDGPVRSRTRYKVGRGRSDDRRKVDSDEKLGSVKKIGGTTVSRVVAVAEVTGTTKGAGVGTILTTGGKAISKVKGRLVRLPVR